MPRYPETGDEVAVIPPHALALFPRVACRTGLLSPSLEGTKPGGEGNAREVLSMLSKGRNLSRDRRKSKAIMEYKRLEMTHTRVRRDEQQG